MPRNKPSFRSIDSKVADIFSFLEDLNFNFKSCSRLKDIVVCVIFCGSQVFDYTSTLIQQIIVNCKIFLKCD